MTLTDAEQKDRLARASVNREVHRNNLRLHVESGGELDERGDPIFKEKEWKFKSDFINRASRGHAQGGAPHIMRGTIPIGKEKDFSKSILRDIYYVSSEHGIPFSTERGIKINAGFNAYSMFPAELKKYAILTNSLGENDFSIEIENGVR